MRKTWHMLLFIAMLSYPALAEGTLNRTPKEYGVNRRVNSNAAGYIGAKGTYHASIAETPPLVLLSKKEEQTYPYKNANHYKSTPTCYLGSHTPGGGKQVDAGLQYYNDSPVYPNHDMLHPGWGAFINYKSKTPTPKIAKIGGPTGLFWEGYRDSYTSQSNVDYKMQYKVNTTKYKGYVVLSVNGGALNAIPQFTWSNKDTNIYLPTSAGQIFPSFADGMSIYSATDLNSLAVKRVIGMTQGNVATYALDGSTMTGTYKDGQVFKYGGAKWENWTTDMVDPGDTGYDVDENAKDAQWNNTNTMASQYILTFPNIQAYNNLTAQEAQADARTNTAPTTELKENGNSRYVEETVKISLRSATKVMDAVLKVRGEN
ncbi:MAG: hypothetical protein ABI210_07140 [Abditibacteriaceae bacterium]